MSPALAKVPLAHCWKISQFFWEIQWHVGDICKLFERQIGSYLILELLVIKVRILKRYLFGQKCFLILTTTLVWIVVDDIQLLNSLWPHGLQHTRLPCLSPSPGVCSNSCPLSRWCYLTISSSAICFLLLPSIFPSIRVFSHKSTLCIRWPKYWSFSISPSNEYSGLIL